MKSLQTPTLLAVEHLLQYLVIMATPKLILGAGIFTAEQGFKSAEDVRPWLEALRESKHLVNEIDSAYLYQQSEEYLGQLKFGSEFAIDTKLPGQAKPGQLATRKTVISQTRESLDKLGVEQVTSWPPAGV